MLLVKAISLILINLIFESSIFPFFSIRGYTPNLSLISIVILAFSKGKYYGGFFGLFTGLLQDLLFGRVIGVKALIYFFIGYGLGIVKENLNTESAIIPTFFTLTSTIIYNFTYFLFMFFLGKKADLSSVFHIIFSLEILYNSLLTFIILKIYSHFFQSTSLRIFKG